ncbi:MAG: hypothetical protein HN534_06565 [Euryarchaeota archaeon]|nr:hypothetical protein [Euryarchaeota archaeon]MBT3654569.1 hypothetical protein [Euryarchaeota archaeon]MBT3757401.1 hypothetical protein [Euryarchaeota archaeon]MBT4050693.1 hypothetical protein [Euryarchaeota archaeon]MBT4347027.1 hypothetical protein [Euryarchaeota archaeon]
MDEGLMDASSGVTIMEERSNLTHRIGLGLILLIQVTLVPIIGFSLTYLIDIDRENFAISIRTELFHWILIAGLVYGIVSLLLALVIGGYRPNYVVDRGGWVATLGFSQRKYDPELIDIARMAAYSSPYGRMARMVNEHVENNNDDLIAVHGGLQLLAVPSQVILISIPILIMEGIPDEYIQPNSAFELGMIGYLIALWLSFRIQPIISNRLVGIAALFRKILWRITKISWILPVVIFWGFARLLLAASLNWLGIDISHWHDIQLEGIILNLVAPEAKIPPTAIIDFLVAISVLPMATFTTISVLGGSNGLSSWMKEKDRELENLSGHSLPAPIEESEDDDIFNIPQLEDSFEKNDSDSDDESEGESEDDQSQRMIDIPFNLFDD